MNFNYDVTTWIKFFIGSFTCCASAFLSGKYLLGIKMKELRYYNLLFLIIYAIFLIFNALVFDNIMKLFGTLTVFFCIYKFSLGSKTKDSFVMAIATCVIYLLGEATTALLISLLDLFFKIGISNDIIKSYLGNVMTAFFSYIYTLVLKDFVMRNIKKIQKDYKFPFVILGIIAISVALSSIYKLSLDNWLFNYSFILNMIIIVGCISLFWILLKQYLKNKEMTDRYLLLNDYLKTSAELIEKYSSTVHKYKNNLIAIKGYLKVDNQKADTYIDSLLENYDSKKYNWFTKINYIQLDAIRYLIYYKLSKAENHNLKISVDVSEDIKKYKNDNLSTQDSNILLDIIGELFDNAIYASNESKEKELNVIMCENNDNIKFILANTYKGEVELSMITKNGYTTKGKGHGLGLYDVEKSIKKHNLLKINYELMDNYFVVTLIVQINKK